MAGALELAACYRYFRPARSSWSSSIPASGRRGAASPPTPATIGSWRPTTACCRRCFDERRRSKVVELTERKYARPTISRTFEGRDRFAPAAGVAGQGRRAGVARAEPSSDYQRLDLPGADRDGDDLCRRGRAAVDRFGNLITNIDRRDVRASAAAGRRSRVMVGGREIAAHGRDLRRGAGG